MQCTEVIVAVTSGLPVCPATPGAGSANQPPAINYCPFGTRCARAELQCDCGMSGIKRLACVLFGGAASAVEVGERNWGEKTSEMTFV